MDHVSKCERYNSVALSIFMMLCNHHVSDAFLTPQGKLPPRASSALAPPPALPAPSAFCLWMYPFWAFHLKGILPSVPFVTGSTHNFLSFSRNIVKGGFVLMSAIKDLHSLPQIKITIKTDALETNSWPTCSLWRTCVGLLLEPLAELTISVSSWDSALLGAAGELSGFYLNFPPHVGKQGLISLSSQTEGQLLGVHLPLVLAAAVDKPLRQSKEVGRVHGV